MKRLLVVDNDPDVRNRITEILTAAGYYTDDAASAQEAISKTSVDDFDIILMDAAMPGINAIETIKELRKIKPRTKVVIITDLASIEDAIESIKHGAADYLQKPIRAETLLKIVNREICSNNFGKEISTIDMDFVLGTISNPLRRKLIKLVHHQSMRFMELNRELSLVDHTRLVFHLKLLKDCGLITQDASRAYVLTDRGARVYKGMMVLETFLVTD
ncbi:MAG: response regulator [Nitrospirae bacterium]|uniref:response regulator n=1 Tax=Candidatus Magnetobacterium casense TaxID=1455061 RepID=UPI0005909775|nr:response regulator [Candidatus Magnetobacterium casensis]MBF0336501.1 response regulator [Nitrospirota bacterium]